MAQVNLFAGEGIESALRRFKRQVQSEEILQEAKKRVFFIPPGERKKLKSKLARIRASKNKRRQRSS
ncbi:MAG: 30S ribosomal protein S21 [Blastocatellia bacterium]|nr:30S ribosomal protein S21 [Blastocatellia bacterium]